MGSYDAGALWAALQEVGAALDPLLKETPAPWPAWMAKLDDAIIDAVDELEGRNDDA